MPIGLWTYVPPVVGVVAVGLISTLLRFLLRVSTSTSTDPKDPKNPQRQAPAGRKHRPRGVGIRGDGDVAGVLAVVVGAVVLLVGVWALAYVGWTAMYFMGALSNPPVLPPWFGNPLAIVGFAVVGVFATVIGLLVLVFFFAAAWFVGMHLLWPGRNCVATDKPTTDGREP